MMWKKPHRHNNNQSRNRIQIIILYSSLIREITIFKHIFVFSFRVICIFPNMGSIRGLTSQYTLTQAKGSRAESQFPALHPSQQLSYAHDLLYRSARDSTTGPRKQARYLHTALLPLLAGSCTWTRERQAKRTNENAKVRMETQDSRANPIRKMLENISLNFITDRVIKNWNEMKWMNEWNII